VDTYLMLAFFLRGVVLVLSLHQVRQVCRMGKRKEIQIAFAISMRLIRMLHNKLG
jgi:hypothetical protein